MVSHLAHPTTDVTQILTYAAQASHELVPSDVLEPVIMAIANNFISERSSPESIIVGSVAPLLTMAYLSCLPISQN